MELCTITGFCFDTASCLLIGQVLFLLLYWIKFLSNAYSAWGLIYLLSGLAAWLLGDPCYITKLWQLQTRACGGLWLHGWTGLFNNELWISTLPQKFVVPRNLIISVVFEHFFCLLLILGDICVPVSLLVMCQVHEGQCSFASILCSLQSALVVLARCSDPWRGESCLYHAILLVIRQPCLFKCSGKVSVHSEWTRICIVFHSVTIQLLLHT